MVAPSGDVDGTRAHDETRRYPDALRLGPGPAVRRTVGPRAAARRGQVLANVGELHPTLLGEVLLVDQRERWRRGERRPVEEYLEMFPVLRSAVDQLVELLRNEFLLRQHHGESPRPDEFQRRFPELAEHFQRAQAEPDVSPRGSLCAFPSTTPWTEGSPATLPTLGAPPVPDALALPAIPGFDIVRELGRGGMGVVYQAFDRKRHKMVALKTMQGVDARTLLRFKQEFRSVAGLDHPNLVSLYELTGGGAHWFFTMEMVEGVHFIDYVRADSDDRPVPPTRLDSSTGGASQASRPGPLSAVQLARLRDALAQLAAGVHCLHESGKLHRDIKPGNVLVTPQGRVVLLDLGLAAELDRDRQHLSVHLLGTVAYMAPEQAARRAVSPASDWYAVGSLLYETLTGILPFDGEGYEILHNKQQFDPPAPSAVLPGTPEDLSSLCLELLRREPEARPTGVEVLHRLARMRTRFHPPPAIRHPPPVWKCR